MSVPIVHIEHSTIKYNCCNSLSCIQKILYKVPKGMLHATDDLFLTRNHELVVDNTLKIPELCGAVRAAESDIALEDGWFHVYHLRLEKECHMIANGCVITTLSSSTKPTGPAEDVAKHKQLCTSCIGTILNIS